MPEPLIPMSADELAKALEFAFSVLRAKGKLGKTVSDGFASRQLAEQLLCGGLQPCKKPPQPMYLAPATSYPFYDYDAGKDR